MANKYSILIEAKIDEVTSKTLIQNNLDSISAKITFKIQSFDASAAIVALKTQIQNGLQGITVGVAGGGSSGISGGPGIPGGNVPIPSNSGDFQSRIDEIQRKATGGTVDTTIVAKNNQIIASTERYTNATNDAITVTQKLNTKTGELGSTIIKLKDNRAADSKAIQKQISDAEKLISTTESITKGKSGKVVTQAKDSVVELTNATQGLKNVQDKTGVAVEQAQQRLANATKTTERFNGAVRAGGKNLQSWGTEIGVALKRTIEWATAMTLLYGTLRQIQQGIKFVAELNKELTNIRLVTGASIEEVAKLSIQYNDLAKSLGATTLEVAKGKPIICPFKISLTAGNS